MTETPGSLAQTPDLLSEMLKGVRLSGAVFMNGRFTAPFHIRDAKSYDQRTPMAQLRHVSILHLIVDGACEFEAAGQQRSVSAGDLVFLPLPNAHRFWSGPPCSVVDASDVVQASAIEGVWTANHGGGGAPVRMVCGYLESSEFLFAPAFRTLPPLIVERTTEDRVGAMIASTVEEIATRVDAASPGSQGVLGRLMELLFVELLRRHVARLPATSQGWFAALNDPLVSRALHLIHAEPAHPWTVDQLAQRAATSRSVLNERFNAVLGRPPIDYLAGWRIQLAANQLRSSSDSLAQIAQSVGYESEAAFSRAFKRITGFTPGRWRATDPTPAP